MPWWNDPNAAELAPTSGEWIRMMQSVATACLQPSDEGRFNTRMDADIDAIMDRAQTLRSESNELIEQALRLRLELAVIRERKSCV